MPSTTPNLMTIVSTSHTGIAGAAFPYPVVHPNHLPQIPNFHGGDQRDGETFDDWLDHFEAVASIARWDPSFMLVHLAAALRGNAKSFYRSYTPTQKSSYPQLVSALKKRFTSVKLTALQTQMFHSRKQGTAESVDDFAQELRKLHSKAYSATVGGNSEAEKVGQIVLVNQFVSGLRSELQAKVVGVEGGIKEIVTKARFEEAKLKELSSHNGGQQQKRTFPPRVGHTNRPSQVTTPPVTSVQPRSTDGGEQSKDRRGRRSVTCYQCGMEGHMRSNCPYPRQPREGTESRGRPQVKSMSHEESATPSTGKQKEIQELREKLRQAELAEAIESSRELNLVVPIEAGPRLGPTVYAPITVDGVTMDALVDTGSPATTVSLEFALKVLRQNRPKEQTDAQWIESTQEKFKDPGGHQLHFIAQIELTLTVLVKKGAPNDLLLGTDVQPKLGLTVVTKDDYRGLTDLFSGQQTLPQSQVRDQQTSPEESKRSAVSTYRPDVDATPQLEEPDSGQPVEHEVRLLQAMKVPAGRQKLVHATIGPKPLRGPCTGVYSSGVDRRLADGRQCCGDGG